MSRLPARVQTKLLAAFLAIVLLLVGLGAVGLHVLSGVNQQTKDLIALQRKIEAYRQLQHDTISQLYGVTSALLFSDDRMLNDALRQLIQFGYDFDRLQFVSKSEVAVIDQVRQEYGRLIDAVKQVVSLIRAGKVKEAREIQETQAGPLADRLERLINKLVNVAEADMVAGIDSSDRAYGASQWIVIGFALGSVLLALSLGYVDLVVADRTNERDRGPSATDRGWRFHAARPCGQPRRTRHACGECQHRFGGAREALPANSGPNSRPQAFDRGAPSPRRRRAGGELDARS